MVSQSKPWWTEDLTKAYRDLRHTREALRGWMKEFHCPSLLLSEQVTQKCKATLKLVQKTKQDYYQKLVANANPQNIWEFRKWTKQRKTFASPPLTTGSGSPPAITHK